MRKNVYVKPVAEAIVLYTDTALLAGSATMDFGGDAGVDTPVEAPPFVDLGLGTDNALINKIIGL